VIPREGVESIEAIRPEVFVMENVIPREGVESIFNVFFVVNILIDCDPERGS